MKTERELFLYELEGHGYEFKNKTCLHGMGDVGGIFDDDQLNMVWEMWCASAQREGYKLVPLEMHWHKADDLASAEWDKNKALFCSVNRDMTAIQVEDFRLRWCKIKANKIMSEYKAIIGAAE